MAALLTVHPCVAPLLFVRRTLRGPLSPRLDAANAGLSLSLSLSLSPGSLVSQTEFDGVGSQES